MTYSENLFEESGAKTILSYPQLEADDCIALTTKHIQSTYPEAKIYIITADLDYLQLVNENTFIYDLWAKWKSKHYVETPVLKRRLTADALKTMTANKLFNYYLQALETEVSVQKLQQVQDILKSHQTCIILYTYDSILFDVEFSEAKDILPQLKNMLEQGNFPVKCKVGNIYDKMKTISL